METRLQIIREVQDAHSRQIEQLWANQLFLAQQLIQVIEKQNGVEALDGRTRELSLRIEDWEGQLKGFITYHEKDREPPKERRYKY